jgi:recombination protein RecT
MNQQVMTITKDDASKSLEKSIQKNNVALNLSQYLRNDNVVKRLNQLVGDNAEKWISTILTVGTSSPQLRECDPKTIVHAAIQSISLKLDIDKNLGFAHIVPYGKVAQFQMGYKGFIQLAIRSGKYQTINADMVYEGEIEKPNKLTGELIINEDNKKSDKIIGYFAYFKTTNGFEKSLYMTKEQIEKHAKTYSKSFNNEKGRWKLDFDKMALKTVLKALLSKYGILSIDMQNAIKTDQSVIKDVDCEDIDYIDVPTEE